MDLTEYSLQDLQTLQIQIREFLKTNVFKLWHDDRKQAIDAAIEAVFSLSPNSLGDFSLQEQTKGAVSEARRNLSSFQTLADEIAELIQQKQHPRNNQNYDNELELA